MVRPSTASLNSLAMILRQAQPLYAECHSIFNHLENEDWIVPLPLLENSADHSNGVSSNKDDDSVYHSILEPVVRSRNGIM